MFVLNKHVDVDTYYLPLPVTCRLVKAYASVDTEVLSADDGVVTFSDGSNDIGTITATVASSAEGDTFALSLDETTEGKVALGPATPLKIVLAGNTNGELELSMIFDEFHADN